MKHFKGGTSYNSLGTYSRLMPDEIRLNLKLTTTASLLTITSMLFTNPSIIRRYKI
jgi:hypothetical protein